MQEDSFSGHLKSFFGTVWNSFLYLLGTSYVSLAGAIVLLIVAVTFIPSKASKKKRVTIGLLHVSAHLAAALFLMLLLELGLETCVRHELLATSGTIMCVTLYFRLQFFTRNDRKRFVYSLLYCCSKLMRI